MKTVYVLNGPNLNLLGMREPAIYGSATLEDVKKLCEAACARHGLALEFRQTNHEGELVDWVHEAGLVHAKGELAAVVMNAAAYTHTSVAILDAVKGTGVPLLELHISSPRPFLLARSDSWTGDHSPMLVWATRTCRMG